MKKILILLLTLCVIAFGALAESALYTADGDDQSALYLDGAQSLAVSGALIQKTGGEASSADQASFQGLNAAVLVVDQAKLTITDSVIESSAPNATGVFASGQGVIDISNCVVTVTGGGAGGIEVAGGGTLYGADLTVTSASKAAIRSDRGGGTMVLTGGTYTSTGKNGCPAIYSTADITVQNAVCASEQSRAVIIEGRNSVTLDHVTIEGNDQSTKEGSVRANVLLYQSASGDAKEGTASFTMIGGTMTCHSGAMFYCTNTTGVIDLTGAALHLSDDQTLLIVSSGRWGRDGQNGGRLTFNAADQALSGAITVDSVSSLDMRLSQGSTLTGSVNASQEGGEVSLTLDETSRFILTDDSYLTSFEGDLSQIEPDGHHLYVAGEQVL